MQSTHPKTIAYVETRVIKKTIREDVKINSIFWCRAFQNENLLQTGPPCWRQVHTGIGYVLWYGSATPGFNSTRSGLCILLCSKQMCAKLLCKCGEWFTQQFEGEKTNQKLLYLPTNLCTDSVFMFKSANTAAKRHKEKNVKQWPSSIVLGVVLIFFANLWTTQVTSTSGIFVLATLWLKTTTKKTRTAETKDKIKSEQNI